MISKSDLRTALLVLFFFSGCSALIYQVMWQRMLFTLFGVDLLSITIIVSVFMFGLGLGGLVGGNVADRWPTHLLRLYIVIEFAIALFGMMSPLMIDRLGWVATLSHQHHLVAVSSFVLLIFPTLLMGATFPLLVTHVNQTKQHIGESVGILYFANSMGGAVGAYVAGFILLYFLTVTGAVFLAASLNVMIAVTAYLLFGR